MQWKKTTETSVWIKYIATALLITVKEHGHAARGWIQYQVTYQLSDNHTPSLPTGGYNHGATRSEIHVGTGLCMVSLPPGGRSYLAAPKLGMWLKLFHPQDTLRESPKW